jgi:hypothetical protein
LPAGDAIGARSAANDRQAGTVAADRCRASTAMHSGTLSEMGNIREAAFLPGEGRLNVKSAGWDNALFHP